MKDLELQLKEELKESYPNENEVILSLIDTALESDASCFLEKDGWNLSFDVEKHHSLQFSYYMAISKRVDGSDDIEINVSYENGIDNGTQIIDYCLEGGSVCSLTKEVQVMIGIEPDWTKYEVMLSKAQFPEALKRLIILKIKSEEKNIMEMQGKQNYDNYVTGGGTCKTDDFYKAKADKLKEQKIFWLPVYETIEADRNFV